ncbi:hypothetical protein BRYFOR_07233 [Marvinbryantia formatexigens DSM 14469]|uniref:Uncharacterized protein n=1 Tax=Marvinbryantia formatexigens DSM 14469 TaxID=478749 RepID=C6LF32_9FIRM|nr:hypothetical protein BRYFOR_07233 [Marvinbryantia formatexigens DSM 14469]
MFRRYHVSVFVRFSDGMYKAEIILAVIFDFSISSSGKLGGNIFGDMRK